MIYGYLYQGSGVGNQLHRYIATRIKALELGVDWRMIYVPDNSGKVPYFKGKDFIKLEEDKIIGEAPKHLKTWNEKKVVENGVDVRSYDPEFNFIEDNTIIDGEFQDERYFEHRLGEMNKWLGVEPLHVPNDVCIIGFRGGEYALYPDLFLPIKYWTDAVDRMLKIDPNMKFRVVTDDPELAKSIFPFEVTHEIGMDWRQCRYAKYAIIANSSFYILPRLLRHYEGGAITIAPRGWARRNTKTWSLPQNYYRAFTYI